MVWYKIKTLRSEKNISQTDLANFLYVTRQTISRWESGKTVPTTENLIQIASFFGKNPEYFFQSTNEGNGTIKIEDNKLNTAVFLHKYWEDIIVFLLAISPIFFIWFAPISLYSVYYSTKKNKVYKIYIIFIVSMFTIIFLIRFIHLIIIILELRSVTTEIILHDP